MTSASVNIVFAEKLLGEGHLPHLAVFMKLKSLYSNSCIFNATYDTMSRKTGIGKSALKKYIPFFKANGWVREYGESIIFEKIDTIDDSDPRRKRIVVPVKILDRDSYKNILKKIKLVLIELVHTRFEYIKKLSNDNNIRQRRKVEKEIRENQRFSISNRSVGKIIKKSKSTASRLMRWGQKNKILEIESNLQKIKPTHGFDPDDKNHGFFVSKISKNIVRQKANYVRFY